MPQSAEISAAERFAAVVVALEAVGVAALVGWQVVALLGGDTESLVSALALAVLTAVGAVAVGGFAFGVWRGASWGRSGGIVTQLLLLAVAFGAGTGEFAHPLTGVLLAAPAVIGLLALLLAARSAARTAKRRDEAAAAEGSTPGEPGPRPA